MKQGWIEEGVRRFHYVDDKLHCKDGPAVVYADGNQQWWLNGKYYGNTETKEYLAEVAKLKK